MIVLFLNEGPPVGFGGCRNGTLWGEGQSQRIGGGSWVQNKKCQKTSRPTKPKLICELANLFTTSFIITS